MSTKQRLTTAKQQSKLSPLEQDLARLKGVRNTILSKWNFHLIHSWADYEELLGGSRIEQFIKKDSEQNGWIRVSTGTDCITDDVERIDLELIKQDLALQEEKIKQSYEQQEKTKEVKSSEHESILLRSLEELPRTASKVTLYNSKEEHPLQICTLFKPQEEAAQEILDKLYRDNCPAVLAQGGTGSGKTFVAGALLRRIIDLVLVEKTSPAAVAPWKIFYVTKASVVEQTNRALLKHFTLDVCNQVVVTNYDSLRATFGSLFVNWRTEVINGEPHIKPEWRPFLHPVLVIWDECQALKNLDSLQSQLGQALNDVWPMPDGIAIKQIFMSATPFTRVIEAKCFAVATRVPFTYGVQRDAPLTNSHWTEFARQMAAPSAPDEHNEAAIGRMMDYLKDYVVRIKNVRPQFRARNGVKIIQFRTTEEKAQYDKAWQTYLARKAEIEGRNDADSYMQTLAQFTIFRKEAELIRAAWLADEMYQQWQQGYAPVAACCFKGTISAVVQILIEKYKVPRSKVSLIWGGLDKKRKVKRKKKDTKGISDEQIAEQLEGMGLEGNDELLDLVSQMLELEEQIEEDDPAFAALPKEYRLGTQSRKQRQEEIDRFQEGKSEFCFFTFKAGGVGLSLHHTDEMTTEYNTKVEGFNEWLAKLTATYEKFPNAPRLAKGKCRRKDNGYVYEEDIKYIPLRPRYVTLTPTYSAPELVQGLGRCPRLTSLSDTLQFVVFYGGTIEAEVALSVSKKLKCLKRVSQMREHWEDVILNASGKATEDISELPQEQFIESEDADADSFLEEATTNDD